jgi:glyoxylase-like metal-dependent hydrolase (beta-lactamase superfamily II)
MRTTLFLLFAGAAGATTLATAVQPVAPPVHAPAPRQIVARALTAIGGEAAARGLRTLSVDVGAMALALGQEFSPEGIAPFSARFGTLDSDWETNRSSSTMEVRGTAIFKVRQALWPTGGIGEFNGTYQPAPEQQVAIAQRALRQAPHRLLLTALEASTRLTALPERTRDGRRLAGVRVESARDTVALWFDLVTQRLAGVETRADDAVLGDRETYLSIEQWGPASGTPMLIPIETRTYANGQLVAASVTSAARANSPLDSAPFFVPDSLAARVAAAGAAPAGAVTLEALAPGVLLLAGGTHNSLALVQRDSTVLIELPLGTPRVRAVLDTLAARYPHAPVRLAVVSHHHWDHAGGVRAAFAAGLPVLTHERNVAFLRRVAAASRTIAPDGVERAAGRHVVRGMRDSVTIGGGDQRVVLYEVPNTHAAGLVAAWVPAARVLFIADLGPRAVPALHRELARFIEARGLAVDRIAGAHGPVMPYADFERSLLAAAR